MQPPEHTPVSLDWTFWAFVVAAIALVLSQLPPLKLLFRRSTVRLQAYSLVGLTVYLGAPQVHLHIIVRNTGGRAARISRLRLLFSRGATQFELPGTGYYVNSTDQQAVLLAPFTVSPDQDWGHIVNFFAPFDQQTLRRSKALTGALAADLRTKRAGLPATAPDVALDPALVAPLITFFNDQFRWDPGDYRMTLQAAWDDGKVAERKFRFTLFESDSQELRAYADDYAYGYGAAIRAKRDFVFPTLEPDVSTQDASTQEGWARP